MQLFNLGVKEDPQRKERLIRIRRSIESSIRFEEDAMSRPLNASSLKRLYNIDSLWIADDEDTKRIGSANYTRELNIFKELSEKFGNLDSFRMQRAGEKYHVMQNADKLYAFSTPIELTNADVRMVIGKVEDSLERKKIFLSSDTNITVE